MSQICSYFWATMSVHGIYNSKAFDCSISHVISQSNKALELRLQVSKEDLKNHLNLSSLMKLKWPQL